MEWKRVLYINQCCTVTLLSPSTDKLRFPIVFSQQIHHKDKITDTILCTGNNIFNIIIVYQEERNPSHKSLGSAF